jgi:tetratricopeptide (TPR) repeat protein
MKLFFIATAFCLLPAVLFAQEDVSKLHETAKAFMLQQDYANASLILIRALKLEPDNIAIAKDLAFDYYLQKENDKGIKVILPFLDKNSVDDQAFQIAGMLYRATGNTKDAENVYKKALKKFPNSGPIFNDYGELLYSARDKNSIKIWETGIQQDPSYANNYYSATKYYYIEKDKIWPLIYGEIFVNLESYTARTAEIKALVLDSYKRLFSEINLVKDLKDKNPFEIAFLTTMNKQNSVVIRGINAESLTMIRTRFILDWDQEYKQKFPFYLFDFQEQMLGEGLFQAYNQWMFGAVQNLGAYENWIKINSKENEDFKKFQRENFFKMPEGQYYR